MTSPKTYDPRVFRALSFHDATPRFREGSDTPRAYLERCLETIARREPAVQAFIALNEPGARNGTICHARLAAVADAAITLSCPGPAPLLPKDLPGQPLAPRPTGDPIFNYASSMLFAPAVTMPLLSVGGLPVGVQLIGQQHSDASITAMARWMMEAVSPVMID